MLGTKRHLEEAKSVDPYEKWKHPIEEENKQINMEGGQSSTYLRLTRALSGLRVSVAKTYRDENETKMNISAQTQRPSSAVEYKELKRNF